MFLRWEPATNGATEVVERDGGYVLSGSGSYSSLLDPLHSSTEPFEIRVRCPVEE